VGCDAATEAHRLGAKHVTLLDVQEPASFGKERAAAEEIGAEFKWPVFTKEITDNAVILTNGEQLAAETVIISIGDVPDLEFLPDDVAAENGFVKVNERFLTTDPKIFAIGDVVRPGLLTDAIGAGRIVAETICDIFEDKPLEVQRREMIDRNRITLEYVDPRVTEYNDLDHCGSQCSSCGACRDCGICVAICPQHAIRKTELEGSEYEYVVDENLCIYTDWMNALSSFLCYSLHTSVEGLVVSGVRCQVSEKPSAGTYCPPNPIVVRALILF
jgi:ferredoxin